MKRCKIATGTSEVTSTFPTSPPPLPHHPRVLLPLPQRLPARRLLLRIAERPASPRVVDVSRARVLRAEHLLRLAEGDDVAMSKACFGCWREDSRFMKDLLDTCSVE